MLSEGDVMSGSQAFTGQHKIKMYTTTWCGDCHMAKRWFDAHGIPYDYINIERDERAAAEVLRINRGMRSVPTIVFPDGSILVEPSARELAAKCLQELPPSLGERLKSLYKDFVKRES
jgi:mycoredoxin